MTDVVDLLGWLGDLRRILSLNRLVKCLKVGDEASSYWLESFWPLSRLRGNAGGAHDAESVRDHEECRELITKSAEPGGRDWA